MTGFRAASALICRTVQVSYPAEKYQKPLNIYEHMHECNMIVMQFYNWLLSSTATSQFYIYNYKACSFVEKVKQCHNLSGIESCVLSMCIPPWPVSVPSSCRGNSHCWLHTPAWKSSHWTCTQCSPKCSGSQSSHWGRHRRRRRCNCCLTCFARDWRSSTLWAWPLLLTHSPCSGVAACLVAATAGYFYNS